MQAGAIEQGRPDLPGRGVKSDIGAMGDTIIGGNIGKPAIDDQAQDIAMLDHYPFRLAGRTGGVNHIGQMAGCQPRYNGVIRRL
ncbi:hypothetical protein Xkoz_03818 [Xenorhabdus kozodoii]|uniref:Uncharacterized protein n=1 Tax=Xenorhabdus kozodoii TaxID=351676 RepID=A0A2D0KUK9_9GAMM|nr:hypothetical protein Xkoz_03818 [Xenorhabdus kozodoii]